jgi:protease IV
MASKSKRLILWLIGLMMLICIVTTFSIVLLMDSGPVALSTESKWLHLRLTERMTEAPGTEGLVMDPADLPPLTSQVSKAIHKAATDDNIHGLLLEIDGLAIGWAQAEEVHRALRAFTASEKPCTAWSETYDTKRYFVAAGCDTVALSPEGLPLVNGMNVNQTYFAGTLEMLDVRANFEHVGDFKSAVEPYERTGPSAPAAEATNALLDSLFDHIVQRMAEGRGIDTTQIKALIDDPPITAKDAADRGLIDERVYRSDLLDRIDADGGRIKGHTYLEEAANSWSDQGTIAVVHADGPIMSGKGGPDMFGDSVIGSRSMVRTLNELREDETVSAVVLRVNSPGGSAMASDDIWNAVERLKAAKPIVASMGDYAASGGYYISMGTQRIFAEPTTVTGSIGVFGGKMNLAGLFAKAGMSQHTFSRGARSDLLSIVDDFDEADKALFRTFLEGFYTTFINKAAQGRGMTPEAIHAVAQGRVWTGNQALDHGLVDEIGGLDAAIAASADLAGISNYSVERLPERKGFMDQLLEEFSNPDRDSIRLQIPAITPAMQSAIRSLMLLDGVLQDGGVAAMLPGQLNIQ